MTSNVELNISRKKLVDALGEDNKLYFSQMKLWFRQKITKEEFNSETRKLLSSETLHLHNEFLLAILNKCQSLTTSHISKDSSGSCHSLIKDKFKKGKVKRKRPVRATFEHRFQPVNPLHYAFPVVASATKDPQPGVPEERRVTFCTREVVLPDPAMIHGRMFVTAWDCGLDDVHESAVYYVIAAVERHIKDILMAIFKQRNSYKLREGKFAYNLGATLPDPYRINSLQVQDSTSESNATEITLNGEHVPSLKPPFEWIEAKSAFSVACSPVDVLPLSAVSLYDLVNALQVHRRVISSHSVYAVNMERIASKLWHPSHEELQCAELS